MPRISKKCGAYFVVFADNRIMVRLYIILSMKKIS